MKIALIGYGKMGKEIETLALQKGHEITLKITSKDTLTVSQLKDCDVAIEFTRPENALTNINTCFAANVPVVVGTTGWYQHFEEVKKITKEKNQALFYATNFSIGVNLFFKLTEQFGKLMQGQAYEPNIEEIHHTEKLDAPSGTAITTAERLLANYPSKTDWKLSEEASTTDIAITAVRTPNVPGTHKVSFNSDIDSISLEHVAHSRKGFAGGALIAAEWLLDKKGVYTMTDLLNF
ncbi:MAG: 4-hydroxy-tetrahydrodipicolinate reductase [Flavobacteriales bacterium]|jgi:4-hydroxy-tetrahydrodipicolinate reductase